MKSATYVLDATVLIDLYEASCVDAVLGVQEVNFTVTLNVLKELKYYRLPEGQNVVISGAEKVRLQAELGVESLTMKDGGTEIEDYTLLYNFGTGKLGPGESEAASIAAGRGYVLVTDDRRARKKIENYYEERKRRIQIIDLKRLAQQLSETGKISRATADELVAFLRRKRGM